MTKIQYLLICLMEELGEGSVEIINFVNRVLAEQTGIIENDHLKHYIAESNDIIACVELLIENGVLSKEKFVTQDTVQERDERFYDLLVANGNQIVQKHLHAQKAVSKMLRFGVNHNHPVYGVPGISVLTDALLTLFAANRTLQSNLDLSGLYDPIAIKAKKEKVYKYLHISIAEGRVLSYEFPGLDKDTATEVT